MRPQRQAVFCSEAGGLLPLSTKAKLVTDDESAEYMRRVEQAAARLELFTGQKPERTFEVRTMSLFDVSSKAKPF